MLTGSVYHPGGRNAGAEPVRGRLRRRRARRRHRAADHGRGRDARPGEAVRGVSAPAVRGGAGAAAPVPSLGAGVRGSVLRRAGRDGKVRGGFDLVLGNPPWIKVEWEERGVLGERNPAFALRKLPGVGAIEAARGSGVSRSTRGCGTRGLPRRRRRRRRRRFLNSIQNYAALAQGAADEANLYKCFLPQGWMIGSDRGVAGFLHPEGVYDDPKGGRVSGRALSAPPLVTSNSRMRSGSLRKCTTTGHSASTCSEARARRRSSHTSPISTRPQRPWTPPLDHDGGGPVPRNQGRGQGKWNLTGHAHTDPGHQLRIRQRAGTCSPHSHDEIGTPPLNGAAPGPARSRDSFQRGPQALAKQPAASRTTWDRTVLPPRTTGMRRVAQQDGTIERRDTRFLG